MLDAGCSIENHRQPSSRATFSPSPPRPPLPLTPHHLEEEIKRAGAQRQTLIPPTPAADALLPTSIPRVVAQPVSNLLPRSTLLPRYARDGRRYYAVSRNSPVEGGFGVVRVGRMGGLGRNGG